MAQKPVLGLEYTDVRANEDVVRTRMDPFHDENWYNYSDENH